MNPIDKAARVLRRGVAALLFLALLLIIIVRAGNFNVERLLRRSSDYVRREVRRVRRNRR
ncbi:hypothetical protein [Vulcanisaeta thermophila]|uniref:hypothetical protein n=1 Tax=Vulcanisaeta thermophila TaxID=867917 RepID=UPI0008534A82|nr:hypothetical protein [Vulcanisaeta thermophila]